MTIRETNLEGYVNRFDEYTELRLQQNTNVRIAQLGVLIKFGCDLSAGHEQ